MTVIGNETANKFWEWNMPLEDKIHPDADESVPVALSFVYLQCSFVLIGFISVISSSYQ